MGQGVDGELVPGVARRAFEQAGIGPWDVSVLECHDATAPAELIVLEELGIAGPGEAVRMIREGVTSLGGALPVNPSVSPLFIVQPLLPGGFTSLFSTHPPIEARIARLEQRAGAYLGS